MSAEGPLIKAVVILAGMIVASRLAGGLIARYAGRVPLLRRTGGAPRAVAQGFIVGLGALVLLDTFGISITPILASLGIGSLAVALALQDTLANLFAGLHILADHPIRVGDFIRLESGQEGYVTQIGWRSTRIRMLPNNVVVVPNSKVVNSTLTNYYLPDPELAVLVEVGVHQASDLARVEQVTSAVGREIMQRVPGGIVAFEPFIRYHTFGESSIQFTVVLRAREFVDQYLITHEFIKALQARYRQEGIVIPFPVRTLDLPLNTAAALREAAHAPKG